MTTDTECLASHPDSPCDGAVEWHPTNPVRWRNNGTMVQFQRCAKHYAEYLEVTEARLEREQEALDSRYCRHGVFVGDPFGPDFMCGRCESGE